MSLYHLSKMSQIWHQFRDLWKKIKENRRLRKHYWTKIILGQGIIRPIARKKEQIHNISLIMNCKTKKINNLIVKKILKITNK